MGSNCMEFFVSTTLIVGLVIGGLILVVGLGFFSQALERARLERARTLAELQARWNYCNSINNSLPGQFMTVELKKLLLIIEANLLERLVKLDARNTKYASQLTHVREQLASGELSVDNAPVTISTEVTALETRKQLGDLLRLLEQARRDAVLDDASYQRWGQHINQHQAGVVLNMHRTLAETAMQQGKPRMAKLQYERAVDYLSKQGRSAPADQMALFRQLLDQAEQAAAQMEQGAPGTVLSEGVQALEEDDQAWRKKTVYDD